jgi:hypothetical protein
MKRPTIMTTLLVATACLVFHIKAVQPQNKQESLRPDDPITETIAWLKSHIPYSYLLPTTGNREVRRWTIGGLQSKDCTLSYDITIQTLDPDTSYFERQLWQIDLAGLNPQMISIRPATKDEPVRIEFTSFDPKDPDLIRQAQTNGGVAIVKGKAIWQNLRIDNHFVREGFETHARFFTRNEERARELAAAFKRGIELCRQNTQGRS